MLYEVTRTEFSLLTHSKITGSLNLVHNFSENINIYEEGPYSIIVEGYYLLVMGAEDPMSYWVLILSRHVIELYFEYSRPVMNNWYPGNKPSGSCKSPVILAGLRLQNWFELTECIFFRLYSSFWTRFMWPDTTTQLGWTGTDQLPQCNTGSVSLSPWKYDPLSGCGLNTPPS